MKFEKKIARMAKNDAYDWGMLQLIADDIAWKNERISGYGEAFQKASNELDLRMESRFLAKQRYRLEKKGFTGEIVSKKGRNIKIALLAVGTVYVLNEMGYLEPVKQKYRRTKLWMAAIQDPESQEYKDLVEETAGKINDVLLGEERANRYKNRKTVPGETVPLESVKDPQELPPEAGGDADDFWPHPGN